MADGATPNRVVRVDNETWAEFGRACEAKGISRADGLRMAMKTAIAEYQRDQRRVSREAASES